jgi:predicted dehydrogenase
MQVVISTPNNTHFPFAKQALQAGKHVLIEKPMCITAAQGEELNKIAQEKGVVLSVYQNRRWDADFLTVQKLLKSGKVRQALMYVEKAGTDGSWASLSSSTPTTTDTAPFPRTTRPERRGKSSRDSTTT